MAEGRLAKPQLRNLHLTRVKKNLVVGITLCLLVSTSYKVFVTNAYERAATNFYKNYDADAAVEKMNKTGYMLAGTVKKEE